MNKRIVSALILGVVITGFASCRKDKGDQIAPYTVPETYNFENVNYEQATKAVNMWFAFQTYLGKSNVRQLSQDTVNNLWNNVNSSITVELTTTTHPTHGSFALPFTPAQVNAASSVKLSSLTTEPKVIKDMADSMVVISQYYNTTGEAGKPGKQGTRIFNYSGFEFNQGVAKGLMGSFAMKNIFGHLDKSVTADNNVVITGVGTAMQHEWDLAYGYLSIPNDYSSTKDYGVAPLYSNPNKPLAIGGYLAERGKYINAGGKLSEAFRRGRAAIGAKDYKVRDEAISTIKEYVEKAIAAAFYYYVTSPQIQTSAAQLHSLSEGYGFMIALKYRAATSKLTAANYQLLETILKTNFYAITDDAAFPELKQAQNILTAAYGQLQP